MEEDMSILQETLIEGDNCSIVWLYSFGITLNFFQFIWMSYCCDGKVGSKTTSTKFDETPSTPAKQWATSVVSASKSKAMFTTQSHNFPNQSSLSVFGSLPSLTSRIIDLRSDSSDETDSINDHPTINSNQIYSSAAHQLINLASNEMFPMAHDCLSPSAVNYHHNGTNLHQLNQQQSQQQNHSEFTKQESVIVPGNMIHQDMMGVSANYYNCLSLGSNTEPEHKDIAQPKNINDLDEEFDEDMYEDEEDGEEEEDEENDDAYETQSRDESRKRIASK
ncbi:hypothetical protein SSS_03054 [Sarcoptes scabiei]|uniref:Uncharacterized protein n=1 Tax=Sarcoptes scabiei TaxID=52283 RepID=A0A834R7G5_SARSC|nr:hypothetical protein SSS_03054 [Sarcoptes scabiei]